MKKVSVITRTKNRVILLNRAIESVTNQSFSDWEMIIVNDGGNPEAVEMLVESYPKDLREKILIIHNEVSKGMEAASNIGVNASSGKYLIIHDDDDSWEKDFLAKSVMFLENSCLPSIQGVICYSTRVIEEITNDSVSIISKESFNSWLKNVSFYRMCAGNLFPPISFLFTREAYNKVNGFREDLPVLGDWEFNLKFMRYYDIGLIPEHLANYHHRTNITSGDLSNSVIGGNNKHEFYDCYLRNDLLRKDIENNRIDIGYLVNISQSFEKIHSHINPVELRINNISNKIEKLRPLSFPINFYSKVKNKIKKLI